MTKRWLDLSERRDPARALLLCLVVLFQLVAATPFAHADGYLEGCVGLTNGGDNGKSPDQSGAGHDHQQCAQCAPLQSALTPPALEHKPAESNAFVAIASLDVAQDRGDVHRPRPPPTGPPTA